MKIIPLFVYLYMIRVHDFLWTRRCTEIRYVEIISLLEISYSLLHFRELGFVSFPLHSFQCVTLSDIDPAVFHVSS